MSGEWRERLREAYQNLVAMLAVAAIGSVYLAFAMFWVVLWVRVEGCVDGE
jgi:hypothetical protein